MDGLHIHDNRPGVYCLPSYLLLHFLRLHGPLDTTLQKRGCPPKQRDNEASKRPQGRPRKDANPDQHDQHATTSRPVGHPPKPPVRVVVSHTSNPIVSDHIDLLVDY